MIRVEFDHTVKVSNYKAFVRAYNAALEIDRVSEPTHIEPKIMVTVFGELSKVRIEFEMDSPPQQWPDGGCPSFVEWAGEHHEGFLKLAERTEVRWLRDVDVSAGGETML